ncbi:hypothetical protein BD413DRAFT_474121 [Trametes elegans]|nr:hypothetical protein BD413DRAFT_474121 [Trametes elegans]
MAAAVFLHNAIFTTEPPPPATLAHRAPNRRVPHDRHLSSASSTVTLHTTATSEHSHPTEPLIHPGSSASSVYLDILARQPPHPSSPPPRGAGLTLQGDPVTPRERRSLWERSVRKRLKRLRWTARVLIGIICGWAVYNMVRYFVGATLHRYRDRQIVGLVLGSCAALSIACILLSIIIAASAPHLGWYYRPRSTHVLLQDFLNYSSSLCLLAPAVVNFVLVFVWRDPSDTLNSLGGRCHWDIDVVWSGLGGQCDHSPAFGYWLAGALVRLVLTAVVIIVYHAVSYRYLVTRRPSRRRHPSLFRHSAGSLPAASVRTGTTASEHSFRAVTTASSTTAPVSDGGGAGSSGSGSGHTGHTGHPAPMRERAVSLSDSEPRALRSARSRIVANDISPAGSRVIRRAVSATALKPRREAPIRETASPSSSDEDLVAEEWADDRYGRAVRRTPGAYASVPLASPSRGEGSSSGGAGGGDPWGPVPDSDLNDFAVQFRALVEQVTRETDEAVAYAQRDRYDSSSHTGGGGGGGEYDGAYDGYYHDPPADAARVVVGRTIHRMPTIESLGSHEVMSLASLGLSRPSTRSNTLSGADGPPSRTASRSNSLDAAVSLSVSLDGLSGAGGVGEMGELATPSPTGTGTTGTGSSHGAGLLGSRSTGSYHTAVSTSTRTDSVEDKSAGEGSH